MNDQNLLEDQPIAWTPTPDVVERAQLTKFMRQVGVSTWDELYAYSIRDVEKFTEEVLRFLDIKFDPPYEKLLDISEGVEFPVWFRSADTPVRMSVASTRTSDDDPQTSIGQDILAGGTGDADMNVRTPSAGLNITEMCLDRWQTDEMKDEPALIWAGEEGVSHEISYESLLGRVKECTAGLKSFDFGKGDAIGIHMPMMPETIIALLAINRIGAIAVPVFSGYGVSAIESRLNAVGAKGLFTCDGFPRRSKFVNAVDTAVEATKNVRTIKRVFVANRSNSINHFQYPKEFVEFEDLLGTDFGFREKTSAEDPLIILYTSGTTGKPKGIAHTHASFPIKAAQDMAFGTDVGKGTRISWYTDIGWMMGPWLIYGALINGATICIYDGAPDYPTPDRIWEFCAKHNVEVLGISPTLIRSLAASEERSADTLVRMDAASASTESTTTNYLGEDEDHESSKTPSLAVRRAETAVRMDAASASTESEMVERRGWYRHKLPHFDGNVTQFITFRLGDSLPTSVVEKIKYRIEHDKHADFSEELREQVEQYLDSGAGECILRNPAVAMLVEETILAEHGQSCDVIGWVVMPNHAHVLLRPYDGHELAGIMKRIKGISARKINQFLGRKGSVWQADYFDRYMRDSEDLLRKLEYIESNPVKAGLVKDARHWRFSSAYQKDSNTPASVDAALESRGVLAGGTGDADKSVRAPFERHDLSALRIFASTGEPWNPAPWWWLFEKVGNSKLPIINYSGGTEIAGGILMGNPLLPIKPCSFPAPCPGMDVDILDEEGNSVEPGKVGELVIKQPWIGMARGFWQEKERYLDAYWRRFAGIWVHGDFAMRDKDNHWFILGRSDDTLKVAGKRVGPSEVESLLVAHPQVIEAAVIGVPDEVKGTAMVAFVVLRSADTPVRMSVASTRTSADDPGSSLDADSFAGGTGDADKSVRAPLEVELKALVAKDMGKPLAPSRIHFVAALPKTRNAKVMRRVIRSAYLGEDPGDLSALEHPETVDAIRSVNPDLDDV
ncbi:MAG: AMP-binding protein [Pyrinomonadaceae bacterium]|nr:AMP-binding protein [Pyrinomonadaceae bacterium]MBP6212996.1 AMP-binding protein [Pyrinomonadaceae bacterium]